MRYKNRQELAGKIDWEGGLWEFLFEYGLSEDDLPEGDDELREAYVAVKEAWRVMRPAAERFVALLPEEF